MSVWISGLVDPLTSGMWVGIIQSVDGPDRAKRHGKEEFASGLTAGAGHWSSAELVFLALRLWGLDWNYVGVSCVSSFQMADQGTSQSPSCRVPIPQNKSLWFSGGRWLPRPYPTLPFPWFYKSGELMRPMRHAKCSFWSSKWLIPFKLLQWPIMYNYQLYSGSRACEELVWWVSGTMKEQQACERTPVEQHSDLDKGGI